MLHCVHCHGVIKLASILLAFVAAAVTVTTLSTPPPRMDKPPRTPPRTCMRRESAILSPPESDCPPTHPVPRASLQPPHAPVSFTPEQLGQLLAQVSILKAIKRGLPVPEHLRRAVGAPIGNQEPVIPDPPGQILPTGPEAPDMCMKPHMDDSTIETHSDVDVIVVKDALEKCTIEDTAPPQFDEEDKVEVVHAKKGGEGGDFFDPTTHG